MADSVSGNSHGVCLKCKDNMGKPSSGLPMACIIHRTRNAHALLLENTHVTIVVVLGFSESTSDQGLNIWMLITVTLTDSALHAKHRSCVVRGGHIHPTTIREIRGPQASRIVHGFRVRRSQKSMRPGIILKNLSLGSQLVNNQEAPPKRDGQGLYVYTAF